MDESDPSGGHYADHHRHGAQRQPGKRTDRAGLFSTSIAVCILLLLSHDRPFTGQLSVKPAVLMQVQPQQSTSP
ncbi:MAG TPA: hypothetical protein VFX42_12275 [Gemmatimonadales bacterium]|nr:hypothetical protein [Gemmatimonadales bacterium]